MRSLRSAHDERRGISLRLKVKKYIQLNRPALQMVLYLVDRLIIQIPCCGNQFFYIELSVGPDAVFAQPNFRNIFSPVVRVTQPGPGQMCLHVKIGIIDILVEPLHVTTV